MAFMGILLSIFLIPLFLLLFVIGEITIRITSVGGIVLSIVFILIYRALKKKEKFSPGFYYHLSVMPYGKYRVFGMKFLRFVLIAAAILSALASALCITILIRRAVDFGA